MHIFFFVMTEYSVLSLLDRGTLYNYTIFTADSKGKVQHLRMTLQKTGKNLGAEGLFLL